MDQITSFLSNLEFEKRFSRNTIEAYRTDLLQFEQFCQNLGENDLLQISTMVIREWIVSLVEDKCENRSVNRKISALKSFYKFLQRQGAISANPLLKIDSLKIRKQLPVFVTPYQTQQLLDGIDFDQSFSGTRNRLIIELFYVTGIRLSELINLRSYDVDKVNLTLKVLGKRNKERVIPITFETVRNIDAYLVWKGQMGLDNEFLFVTEKGLKLYPKFVYRLINAALRIVSTLDKRSPHVLRHTFATHMLNNGAEINAIKELLGHSSLAATQVYTHNSFEKLKKIYEQAHPRG